MQRGARDWRFRVEDILEALGKIARYIAGMTYEDLIHEYFGIDQRIIWQTMHEDLPPLVPQLQRILDEIEE